MFLVKRNIALINIIGLNFVYKKRKGEGLLYISKIYIENLKQLYQ